MHREVPAVRAVPCHREVAAVRAVPERGRDWPQVRSPARADPEAAREVPGRVRLEGAGADARPQAPGVPGPGRPVNFRRPACRVRAGP
ncbi:hypothetical protein GCM10010254_09910 [Streptomyces chromofuscus]|nr:hypothetical protein GCM10010254_09910 [Streptomyces chromofuscus]